MRRKLPGFTLIELLVVITVILVLGALVFVVAKRGMDAAHGTRCVNNVRQLVAAQLAITGDTNGYLIHPGRTPIQGTKRNFAMHFTVAAYDDLGYSDPGDKIRERVDTVQMLNCPVAYNRHQAEMKEKDGAGRWRTYCLNNRIGYAPGQYNAGGGDSKWGGTDGAYRIEQVEAPSLLMMVCERSWNGNNYPSSFGPHSAKNNPIDELHNGGFHVGFMDGHVERMTYAEFPFQGNELPDGRTVKFKANPYTPEEKHWSLVWRGMQQKRSMSKTPPE